MIGLGINLGEFHWDIDSVLLFLIMSYSLIVVNKLVSNACLRAVCENVLLFLVCNDDEFILRTVNSLSIIIFNLCGKD